jgi:hypothetical protein
MILHVLLVISSLLAFTQALDITGSIHLGPSPALLPPSTLVVLSAPNLEYKTHPSADGAFTLRNVTAGPSYLLQVQCLTHGFPPMRIDTESEVIEVYQTLKGSEWSYKGAKLAYPLQLVPSGKAEYYIV